MNVTGRRAAALTGAVAFANDRAPVGLNGNAHLGNIDGGKGPAIFAGEDATGFHRFPVPAVEAENAVRLRDRKPALDVGELTTMGFAGADLPAVEIAP